jgi:hypothetical protein
MRIFAWPLVFLASCGARTGLLAPDFDASVDAGPDAMPVGCMPGTFALTKAQPTLMFVLDRSGSMGMRFSGNASRWQVLTSSLKAALPPVDMTMQIGALMFPSTNGGGMTCNVPGAPDLLPGLGHTGPLLALMTKTQPGGSTPTADALDVAAKALLGVRAASTARALVLATDGGPNCNASLDPKTCTCLDTRGCGSRSTNCLDDKRTVSRITSSFLEGLPTYVIGIQNQNETQNNAVLDEMADAGGRPKTGAHHFYAATSEPELDAALVAIRDQLGACTYLTTSVPDPSGTIIVLIDGVPVTFDASGMTGWHWADRSNGEIVFSGDTCAKIAASPNPRVEVNVTCGSDGGIESGTEGGADASDARSDSDSD